MKERVQKFGRFLSGMVINYQGRLDSPGYSYRYCGGAAIYCIMPNEVMEMNCLLHYDGENYFEASLGEPMSCIVGGYYGNYHTNKTNHDHTIGVKEGGSVLIMGGCGPMGLGAIARYAAGLIGDDDVVFLDAGTTVLRMAEHLRASKATFVTNSVECAQRLPRRGLRAYVLGGVIKPGTLAIIGGEAMEGLKKYYFTKTFLGANGIAAGPGFTTPDPEEAMVKTTAAVRAHETWVLADSSKFGTITAASVLPLSGARIVTDRLDDHRYLEYTDIKVV